MKDIIKCREFPERRKRIYIKKACWVVMEFIIILLWGAFYSDKDLKTSFWITLFVVIFAPIFVWRKRVSIWTIATEVEIDDDVISVKAECLWRDRSFKFNRQTGVYIGDRGDAIAIAERSRRVKYCFHFESSKCWPEDAVAELRDALLKHGWTLEEKYI